jgi:type I restriction-modification system DNA methylase subunit
VPIIDTQDARELDGHLQRFFDANPAERPHRLRQLFTEKFDFNPTTGKVSLAKAPQNITLPSDADRIASAEGVNVIYVPLQIPGTTRVRKAEVVAAAKLVAGQLGDDMLLLMTNKQAGDSASQLHVILPTFLGSTPALRRMVIERDLPRRTALQQLSNIYHHWQQKKDLRLALEDAFNVEAVTTAFFQQYREVFERVQGLVKGFPNTYDGREAKKLFVQTFFNRLMFIYFLSRKGWLKFEGDPDYMAALWKDYRKDKDAKNFYEERLKLLFFTGLNNPRSADLIKENAPLHALIGEVPFLNGGLFDKTTDEIKQSDVAVPDEAIDLILHELFEHYNFTVTESTPLDQEVAVDPEMLGKVFEELVTGRHETGSYYTPRPVVSFMCREALKGYLQGVVVTLPTEAIERFVDQHDVSGLNLASAEAMRKALERIKVVDPACGSGAYLLGMMHELVELETALYSEKLLMDTKSLYDLKLRIIEANVYGVDIDQFAVNIAMLRLWLSLAIDYESFPPPPLPNLDFKIVCGDSLTAPDPNPNNYGTLFRHRVHDIANQLADLKGRYIKATSQEKANLTKDIDSLRGELRKALTDAAALKGAMDWRVEFAEVFANVGFDIVLANPPYVRADAQFRHLENEDERQAAIAKWKDYRAVLLKSGVYQTLYEKWDLYLPFLERAYQLLSASGRMVFIISDAYNAAKYAQKSHEFFLNNARIERIDFCTDIPLFQAGINNTIVHFAKVAPDSGHQPLRARRWGENYDDFERNIGVLQTFPQKEYSTALFRLDRGQRVQTSVETVNLGDICYVSYGMAVSSDEKRFPGEFVTEEVVSELKDKWHPKPWVEGKDLLRWSVRRIRFLEWGTNRAPAKFRRKTFPELHEAKEKLLALRIVANKTVVAYDDRKLYSNHTAVTFVPWHQLAGVRNNSIKKTAKYRDEVRGQSTARLFREDLEELSEQFQTKYLLAVMNSTVAGNWLATRRRGKLDVYPDDWKGLPIPNASAAVQSAIVARVDEILVLYSTYGHPLPAHEDARLTKLEVEIEAMVSTLYEPSRVIDATGVAPGLL